MSLTQNLEILQPSTFKTEQSTPTSLKGPFGTQEFYRNYIGILHDSAHFSQEKCRNKKRILHFQKEPKSGFEGVF